MHGLILAGGEGSRLAAEGVEVPKPLLEVGGEPLAVRLLGTLAGLGCETLTCMVRADATGVRETLAARRFGPPLAVRPCRTPSSLHTLAAGLRVVSPGLVFCTMVDTIMRARDWRALYDATARQLARGADLVLAVTPYVDDESPLYVATDAAGVVSAVGSQPVGPPQVTGGVYGLSGAARRAATEAVDGGVERMRGFLTWLVARGARIRAVGVPRIIDLDHESDLRLANAWLGSAEALG
jgi:NDP-sugar pyrophosphorylase family protein